MKPIKTIGISILAIVILIVSQLLGGAFGGILVVRGASEGIGNIFAGILYLLFTVLLLLLFYVKIMHFDLADFGMPKFGLKIKWVITAVLLPVIVTGIYLLFLKGEYVSSGMDGNGIFGTITGAVFFVSLAAAFVEEMVFRGIILNALDKTWNRKVAVILPSLLFGIVHVIGMDFSPLSCALVIIAGAAVGVMFSLIAIESGSVWSGALVHAAWNLIVCGGILTVSDTADEFSIMTYVLDTKQFAFTGGEFGIESSVIAVIAYIIVCVIAYKFIKNNKTASAITESAEEDITNDIKAKGDVE